MVGDIVTSTVKSNERYNVINTRMLKGKVIRFYEGNSGKCMTIIVLNHAREHEIGISYHVEASRDLFKHVRPRNNVRKIE